MKNFKDLIVWQKAMDLVEEVYVMTRLLPENEKFGLISQLRRASVSIAANIAEGSGRGSQNELRHFLQMAIGSSFELETEILLCINLRYVSQEQANKSLSLLLEVQKMTHSLIGKIKTDQVNKIVKQAHP